MHQMTVFARMLAGIVLLTFGGPASVADEPGPEITAQGFDIAERQTGTLGRFERLRVRFEVPGRIDALEISERSYDVDLATTPEVDHLPLFGLDRQVRQLTDVTLDFQDYINSKVDSAGDYEFRLTVVDRHGQSAAATLLIEVADARQGLTYGNDRPLRTERFSATRIGAARPTSNNDLGFSWTTVVPGRVVIRLTPIESGDYFFPLLDDEFVAVETQAELRDVANRARRQKTIDMPTADDGAAGQVFGLVSSSHPIMLKISRSQTSLSEAGTTVTLSGEYRF